MGGAADTVTSYLRERYQAGLSRDDALRLAVGALGHGDSGDRTIPADDLEVEASLSGALERVREVLHP